MPPKGRKADAGRGGGGGGAGAAGARKKSKLYKMPEKLTEGTILNDLTKTDWKIGPTIGTGGFGEIYTACKSNEKKYDYVVKCEPHDNGPLFVEMHFYMRNAKQDEIRKFQKAKGLKSLGMPYMVGNGSTDINGIRHRFIVLPRYGSDVNKHFLANGRRLPEGTVYRIAIQMLEVYEFIHDCGYIHADLKAANILLGSGLAGTSGPEQAYLLDFGLASHYITKDFKPDPKKMHNGTIEYTSRDAHLGVATMRSDMEILGYNLIEWLGGVLPWVQAKILTKPIQVQKSKELFMEDLKDGLKKAFSTGNAAPSALSEYLNYVRNLKYDQKPDYAHCKKVFLNSLKLLKVSTSGPLEFKLKATPTSPVPSKRAKMSTKVNHKEVSSRSRGKKSNEGGGDIVDASDSNQDEDTEHNDDDDDGIFESRKTVKKTKRNPIGRKQERAKTIRKPTTTKKHPVSNALDTTIENTLNTSFNNEIGSSGTRRGKGTPQKSPIKRHRQPLHNFHSDTTLNNSEDFANTPTLNNSISERQSVNRINSSIQKSSTSTSSPSVGNLTKTRSGRTIVNNAIPQKKSSKTYEFNFELDVSIDANVIVNVKRKSDDDEARAINPSQPSKSIPTTPSTSSSHSVNGHSSATSVKSSGNSSTPLPRVRVQKYHNREDGRSPQQQPTPDLKLKRVRRDA